MLTLENISGEDIQITYRPYPDFDFKSFRDSSVVVLPPDSSIQLLSVFGGMTFNVKIRERDLPMDYLRIEAPQTTIVAKSRKEIIQLIYGANSEQLKVNGQNLVRMKVGS